VKAIIAWGSGAVCGAAVAALLVAAPAPAKRGGSKPVLSTHVYSAGYCRATDGDTVRCGDERIRLVELDTPELAGHCRRGRVCVAGDPYGPKQKLQAQLQAGPVTVRRYGADRYGRTLGDVRVRGASMSCMQITSGGGKRELKWGSYGVTAKECPAL
jgi:micrococcal nuclease